MGIDLVKLLLVQHASERLSGREFKVLCYMAATALDQPNSKGQPARLYFAGEEPLAQVLGYTEPTPNALREVRRVVAALVADGLIDPKFKPSKPGTAGVRRGSDRQTYRLRIGGALGGQSAQPFEGQSAQPFEGQSAPESVGTVPTPRTDTGPTEDSSQDGTTPSTASATGRARAGVADTDGCDIEIDDESSRTRSAS